MNMSSGGITTDRAKPKYSGQEDYPSVSLSTTNLTCTALWLKLDLYVEKPATNHPRYHSHSTAILKIQVFWVVMTCQLVK
jgi:hypothetical protein